MTDWASRVMDEVDGALPPVTEGELVTRTAERLRQGLLSMYPENPYRAIQRLERDFHTGYATENVVPVTTAEQDATLEWIEAIHWATGEDVR